MRIVIQKFGGTSVATDDARVCAAKKVSSARDAGYAPVVVVSAMGRIGAPYATDTLIQLVKTCDRSTVCDTDRWAGGDHYR